MSVRHQDEESITEQTASVLAAPPSKKKQKSKINDMSHDFSSKEVARLHENEASFQSGLFKLQVCIEVHCIQF